MIFRYLILILLAVGACAPAVDQHRSGLTDASPLVLMVAGQSNASGRGALGQLPTGFNDPDPEVLMLTNAWHLETAVEPIDNPAQVVSCETTMNDTALVGPGLAFAREVRVECPDSSVVLVACNKGGSTISQWQEPTSLSQANAFFSICMRKALYARAQWSGPFTMLWYQGESDASDATRAAAYQGATEDYFADLRAAVGDVFPIEMVELHPTNPNASFYLWWDDVRAAQVAIAASDATIDLTEASGTLNSDHVHLTTASQLALGATMAATYVARYGCP